MPSEREGEGERQHCVCQHGSRRNGNKKIDGIPMWGKSTLPSKYAKLNIFGNP